MEALCGIEGLHWEDNWRVENGNDSFVVPFATTRPANVVFHGEGKFDYGHYGIHLGQGDRLTFLGEPSQMITGYFIDCRKGSSTFGLRGKSDFHPGSQRALYVPPGVAHAFENLGGIFTINDYRLFLPDPKEWASGETEWTIESDVVNVRMDLENTEIPEVVENKKTASEVFYRLVAERQLASLPEHTSEYPFTEDVDLGDGSKVRVMLAKKSNPLANTPDWEKIEGIEGAGWERNLAIASGPHSGFVAFPEARPFYIIDHGHGKYNHDAFGIHLGQEDQLTFLGPLNHKVRFKLVDCRDGSPTLHNEVEIGFFPSALRRLIIPPGVAHAFTGIEKVYTLNKPKLFLNAEEIHQPGNDVIDWPLEKRPYPKVTPNNVAAEQDYYIALSRAQKQQMVSPAKHGTPLVLVMKDHEGNDVRVSLRAPQ